MFESEIRLCLYIQYPGNIQELLSYSDDFPEQLAKFLEPHDHISWLHHLASQDYPMVIYIHLSHFSVAFSPNPILPSQNCFSVDIIFLSASEYIFCQKFLCQWSHCISSSTGTQDTAKTGP